MKSLSLLLVLAILGAGVAGAQMDLAIGGSLTGGGNLTIDVTSGPAHSPFFIIAGDPGMTTIPGFLTIDLINPVPLLMVPSDQNGAISLDLPLANPMLGMTVTLSAQVVAIDLSGFGPPPGGPGMGPGPGGPPVFPLPLVKSDVENFSVSL